MGLINLFNAMALRPHIPYRFKAEIWPNYQNAYDNNDKIFRPLEFTIKRISQPVFKLDTENKLNFGNTVFVVPILKFGDTTMEITFEETDDMRVFKTLSGLMGNELFKGVNGGLLNIRITQFDETMLTISDKKTYICRLKEYGTPSFNNNGHGSPIEISATFKVVYVVEEPTVLEEIKDGYRVIIREKLPENERITNEAQAVADEEDKQKMSKGDFDKKMRDRKIMDVLKAEQIKTSAGVAQQAMIAMGYDPTKESQVKMFDAELKMRNINLDDGLNNAELKTITQMVKDYVDPQYATEDLLSNLNENINALEKLNTEYNNLLKESATQKSKDVVLQFPKQKMAGKQLQATGAVGMNAVDIEHLKAYAKAEFLGTNNAGRTEGASNLVYMNPDDGGKQKGNFGMGNTQVYLEGLGLKNEKFTMINTKTGESYTGTMEDLTGILKTKGNAISVKSVWRLDENSTNRIENASMTNIASKLETNIDKEILSNMDAATIGGVAHLEYGAGGASKKLGTYLASHKEEAIADLQKNKGQFSEEFVNQMMTDKTMNRVLYKEWEVKEGKNAGKRNAVDRRGRLTGKYGHTMTTVKNS
ncbi:MAG: hypothetical protein J6T10_17665 [Methanobrevibacter sp.]|nr:hypothetical protein [Methanobrevibacter sp.]